MNKCKYRIPLFGPYYSNSLIVQIIRTNTDLICHWPVKELRKLEVHWPLQIVEKRQTID